MRRGRRGRREEGDENEEREGGKEPMVVEVAMVEKVGKGIRKVVGTGELRDSDDPPCDFKYVHRLRHASAVPRGRDGTGYSLWDF